MNRPRKTKGLQAWSTVERCGAPTRTGITCRWPVDECPVASHRDGYEACGAATRAGTPCRWPASECPIEIHRSRIDEDV